MQNSALINLNIKKFASIGDFTSKNFLFNYIRIFKTDSLSKAEDKFNEVPQIFNLKPLIFSAYQEI